MKNDITHRLLSREVHPQFSDGIFREAAEEIAKLRDALRNMMGVYDTPVSRRRYPPNDFMREALQSGRDALVTTSIPRHDGKIATDGAS